MFAAWRKPSGAKHRVSVIGGCAEWKSEALVALAGEQRWLTDPEPSTVLICPALPLHYAANLHNAGPAVTQPAWFNIHLQCVCDRVINRYTEGTDMLCEMSSDTVINVNKGKRLDENEALAGCFFPILHLDFMGIPHVLSKNT